MDWIKIEKATARKPEVLRIAAKLGVHPDHAFGICFRFWSWCDDNLETCNALGVTDVMLDALLNCDGAATALVEVGWLQVRNGSLVIPNFDRHLSESAKKRGLSASRTAKSRSRKCNAKNVTAALPDKRREDTLSKDKVSESSGWKIPENLDTPEIRSLLDKFASMRVRRKKPIGDFSNASLVLKRFDSVEHLVYALETCIANEYQGLKPEYRPADKPRESKSERPMPRMV